LKNGFKLESGRQLMRENTKHTKSLKRKSQKIMTENENPKNEEPS